MSPENQDESCCGAGYSGFVAGGRRQGSVQCQGWTAMHQAPYVAGDCPVAWSCFQGYLAGRFKLFRDCQPLSGKLMGEWQCGRIIWVVVHTWTPLLDSIWS